MIKLWFFSLWMLGFLSCKHTTITTNFADVDTLHSNKFLNSKNICSFALAKGFEAIRPQMIPWATDTSDLYSESYLINGKKLKITQPLKRFDFTDSIRSYSYDGRAIKIFRILSDSLNFNFNDVIFDYGDSPQNVFQNGTDVLLRNEPMNWNGLANQYRFIQLFDLKKLVCYEFFVNYYACLNEHSSKQKK